MNLIEFGTISHIKKGKKPLRQTDKPQDGYMPYVDIEAFETCNIKMYTDGEKCLSCKAGDILIVCDGSRSGFVGKAIDGYVGSTLAIISADGMSQEYLYYFLLGKYALLNTKKKGTGTPHLDANILNQQKLVVPLIDEQKRIVAKIEELFSELDNGVETLKKTKQQLAVYRQAVLKEAFENCKTLSPIRDMSTLVTSGSRGWAQFYASKGWAQFYASKGAKFIRIGNLTRDSIDIDFSDTQYVNLPDKAEGLRSKLQPNDVLVSITADLGSIGLVPSNIGEAYINQHIAVVRFKNAAQGKFMAWYLRSDWGQKDLLKNKRGAGKLGLGLDDIRDSRVPVVSDEEAEAVLNVIESRLSVCDSIEKTVDTTLQQAEAMRQSILKKAFEGKL